MNNTTISSAKKDKTMKYLALILFLPILTVPIALNNDIWFILNSGRYVMEKGIPYIEPFSMHENMSFVMQQWLTDVIYWNIYKFIGEAGLIAFVCLMVGLTIWVIYKTCLLVTENNYITSVAVSLVISLLLSNMSATRPQMTSMLIFAIEIYCTECYIRKKKLGYLFALPVLSLALINLHASMWLMFFVVALPFIADSFKFKIWIFNGEGYKKLPYFATLAASAAAGFVNPYGIDAMTYLFRSYGYDEISSLVGEMAPPSFSEPTGILIFAFVAVILFVLFINRNGGTKLRYLLLGLGTFFLAMTAYRNFFIFLIGIPCALAFYFKDAKLKERPETEHTPEEIKSAKKLRTILIAAMCVCVVAAIGFKASTIVQEDLEAPSKGAADYILANNNAGDVILYTSYDDGDYFEFVGIKCYLDARAEVFLDSNNGQFNYMKEYVDMQRAQIHYTEVLNKYAFTHIYAGKTDILYTYLPYDSNYKMVYEDDNGRVYVPVN